MRRETESEAALRRRLERIGREHPAEPTDAPEPVLVRAPGRHARTLPIGPATLPVPPWRPAHLVVVATAVALALALTAWLTLRSRPHEVDAPVARTAATTRPSPTPTSSNEAAGDAPTVAVTPTSALLVVDVTGRVHHPGIVRLPAGSRVVDAIRRAGGPRPGAHLGWLNLARPVTDGEQIVVGRRGDPPAVASSGAGAASGAEGSATGGAMVHLNSATLAELDTLPGVGPVTAQKIVDWRTAHGRFDTVEELLEVDGIGDKTMADIAPHVTL